MTPHRFGKVGRFLLRLPTHLYDWHIGWLFDSRLLCLTHVGRNSGRHYQTVLEVVGIDPATGEVIVMSGFGRSADWFRNLQAAPAEEIAISRRCFRPQHRILDETEAVAVLADYERRNRLITPIIRRGLGWLVGCLVHQLPMVGFRPLHGTD